MHHQKQTGMSSIILHLVKINVEIGTSSTTTTNTGPLHQEQLCMADEQRAMNVYSSNDKGGRKDKRREEGEGLTHVKTTII